MKKFFLLFIITGCALSCYNQPAGNLPIIERIVFNTLDSLPLGGTLYLPLQKTEKIIIMLNTVAQEREKGDKTPVQIPDSVYGDIFRWLKKS